MFSKWTILPLAAVLLMARCELHGPSGHDVDLLTETPWKYEKAGFDSNNDGIFDALDPRIAGCEKDDTIVFRKDGTGTLEEGELKCKVPGPDSLPFFWSFQNNDSTIYFQDQYYKVRALTNSRFEIYADQKFGGASTRYTIVFKH
jgi:hypothetical protein